MCASVLFLFPSISRKTLISHTRFGRYCSHHLFNSHGPYSLLTTAIKNSPSLHLAVRLLQHGYEPNKYEIYAIIKVIRDSMGTINERGKHVIACYLAAGHKTYPGEDQLIDNLQLPPNQGFETEALEWIKSQITFQTLKELCRTSIRDHLRILTDCASILNRLYHLSDVLPPSLLDYLALGEFTIQDNGIFKPMSSFSDGALDLASDEE